MADQKISALSAATYAQILTSFMALDDDAGGNLKGLGALLASSDGTFTPTLLFGGAMVGRSDTATGHWWKPDGDFFILCFMSWIFTAKGSSTGIATIGSLPDGGADAAADNGGGFGYHHSNMNTLDSYTGIRQFGTGSTLSLSYGNTSGGTASLTDAMFGNASHFRALALYRI